MTYRVLRFKVTGISLQVDVKAAIRLSLYYCVEFSSTDVEDFCEVSSVVVDLHVRHTRSHGSVGVL